MQGWNTSAQAGAVIFVGYGTDATDMLNNGKFKLVATLPQAPAPVTPPPVTPPPVVTNSYAAYNGSYLCMSTTGATYSVTATFTATQAVVDTSRILTIPDYTISVPFASINTSGNRVYNNTSFPLRMVLLDMTPGERYPLGLAYGATASSSPRVFVCSKS